MVMLMRRVGVLALQGDFAEHIAVLHRLEVEAVPVRLPSELNGVGGLIIPGGESTTIGKLMREYQLTEALNGLIAEGIPLLGTCAGMVMLASRISGMDQQSLGAMDIEVKRNAFGRQVDSFESDLDIPVLGQPPFHAVFIRAPVIESVGDGVEILARLADGSPVAARQNNLVATAFHPEIPHDLRFHKYFLSFVDRKLEAKAA
ncbi:MAG: pyridoxal 5'-phosphate synthase glutaminase subunit PdxT [Dehalococcoidia bacterium]|nr:MAG: pyridoxal 5'-phosphate synthase glutaminase subunit PdxT [Dehalococcoidia bacterium]